MPMMRIVVGVLGAWLVAAPVAHAGPAEDCNQTRDLGRQLRGCTAYIKQGAGGQKNLATAYLNRANVYAQRGKYPLAFADFASAIGLDPSNALSPYNRGTAYFDTRQYELAIADFTRAIELEQRFALAYLNRGLSHEARGDNNAAAEDYRRVLALDPAVEAAQRRLRILETH
jgi:tetratricopeptide (TPR) repeat protein